jgi:hypothetical protein
MSQITTMLDTLLKSINEMNRDILEMKELVKASVFLEQEPGKLSTRPNSEVVSSEPLGKEEKKTPKRASRAKTTGEKSEKKEKKEKKEPKNPKNPKNPKKATASPKAVETEPNVQPTPEIIKSENVGTDDDVPSDVDA